MLFQMCYGPEIPSVYNVICTQPGITLEELTIAFSYSEKSDITSLIENTLSFLVSLHLIEKKEDGYISLTASWDNLTLFRCLTDIRENGSSNLLNYIFASLYFELYVKQNKMYIDDLHYYVNKTFSEVVIGKEKINAWKRIMECFGLGYRIYSGFYALPHPKLFREIINKGGTWDGPLLQYCQEMIHPFIPCIWDGKIFDGTLMALHSLHQERELLLERKQDLPYPSYGPKQQWNWITIQNKEEVRNVSLSSLTVS